MDCILPNYTKLNRKQKICYAPLHCPPLKYTNLNIHALHYSSVQCSRETPAATSPEAAMLCQSLPGRCVRCSSVKILLSEVRSALQILTISDMTKHLGKGSENYPLLVDMEGGRAQSGINKKISREASTTVKNRCYIIKNRSRSSYPLI